MSQALRVSIALNLLLICAILLLSGWLAIAINDRDSTKETLVSIERLRATAASARVVESATAAVPARAIELAKSEQEAQADTKEEIENRHARIDAENEAQLKKEAAEKSWNSLTTGEAQQITRRCVVQLSDHFKHSYDVRIFWCVEFQDVDDQELGQYFYVHRESEPGKLIAQQLKGQQTRKVDVNFSIYGDRWVVHSLSNWNDPADWDGVDKSIPSTSLDPAPAPSLDRDGERPPNP